MKKLLLMLMLVLGGVTYSQNIKLGYEGNGSYSLFGAEQIGTKGESILFYLTKAIIENNKANRSGSVTATVVYKNNYKTATATIDGALVKKLFKGSTNFNFVLEKLIVRLANSRVSNNGQLYFSKNDNYYIRIKE